MSLSGSRSSVSHHRTPQPPPAAAAAASKGAVSLESVLQLIADPTTASQYARHAAQLTATLQQAGKSGFNAQVARDGVPQLLAFMARAIREGHVGAEALVDPIGLLIQHCGAPIVCTTLSDQRAHVEALEGIMTAVGGVLDLPHASIRVTAGNVLRQIFAQLRAQCFDDINKNPSLAFHRKKDLDRAITPAVVSLVLAAWGRTIDAAVNAAVTEANVSSARRPAASEQPADSSDDDAAADGSSPVAAASSSSGPTSAAGRGHGFEMIVLLRAVLELAHYRRLCECILAGRGVDMCMATLQLCGAGDQLVPLTVELLWDLLVLCPHASETIGQRKHLNTLHTVLIDTLGLGFKLQDRELRNDIIVVLGHLARDEHVLGSFGIELIDLLLVLGCGAESGRGAAVVNPTHHATTSAEDLQLKFLCWDVIASLCRDGDIAAHVFDWGLYDVLLAYVNVDCEIPAVVSWSTLQVLDIQAHVLRLLSDLMDRGCAWFSACRGPATLRTYVDECPRVALRNEAMRVLASAAATKIRRDLIDVGAIALAVDLLHDAQGDLDLRIDCLNLLSDVVRRDPELQHLFDDHGGVSAVLPLLTIEPDEYTDLRDDVVFAAVDCVWQCVFGSSEIEDHFVSSGGIAALLTVLESSKPEMAALPLSCLADLLRNPAAAQQCRAWRSGRTGRSGVQIALSFWSMAPLDPADPAEAIAENTAVGLAAVGADLHTTLSPDVPKRAPPPAVQDDMDMTSIELRNSIREPPEDIAHVVKAQDINFKVFALLAVVGFEGHNELDAEERATLAAVDHFVALCKDEVWENIEESLAAEGIEPIAADREVLDRVRREAEERSTTLLATRRAFDEIHTKRKEESEKNFYKSLMKKTEERQPNGTTGRGTGLSITEAKIRKAQMLKQSFKQAVSSSATAAAAGPGSGASAAAPSEQPARGSSDGPTGRTGQKGVAHGDSDDHHAPATASDSATDARRSERWDPGQREMKDDEYEVLRVLNEVRTNPKAMVPLIEEKLSYLDESGSTFYVPGCDPETCVEGADVYHEAMEFLRGVRPLVTLLDVPVGMVFAARDHVADLGRRMDVSQDGADKSTPQSRLKRYASHIGRHAQLTSLGQRTPLGIVMQLVVDDGVSSRVDRQSIFDPDARLCGIAVGPHSIHDTVAVIMLAHEFTEVNVDEQRRTHANVLGQHANRK